MQNILVEVFNRETKSNLSSPTTQNCFKIM